MATTRAATQEKKRETRERERVIDPKQHRITTWRADSYRTCCANGGESLARPQARKETERLASITPVFAVDMACSVLDLPCRSRRDDRRRPGFCVLRGPHRQP